MIDSQSQYVDSHNSGHHNRKALGCGCLGLFAGLIVFILFGASAYLLNYALKPSNNKGRDYPKQYALMKKRYPWIRQWVDSLQRTGALRDTLIMVPRREKRFNGVTGTWMHALLVDAPHKTGNTAILIPGYTDCAANMLHFGYIYGHLMGMNLVIPDLHANGKSDGEAMQMGWKDREDVNQWISIASYKYRDSLDRASIVVHGVSMGAATAMNVSGGETSKSVKCFVEDCGYTSVWDEFDYEIGEEFGLPTFPLLYTASALCDLKYGWSFGEASSVKEVAKCRKPMLFIHGGNDHFVPTRMVYSLYAAKPAPKQLVVFHGSRHARSYRDHRKEYEKVITAFVSKYMK